eukprot:792211-Prymnesium_polylepis.1
MADVAPSTLERPREVPARNAGVEYATGGWGFDGWGGFDVDQLFQETPNRGANGDVHASDYSINRLYGVPQHQKYTILGR